MRVPKGTVIRWGCATAPPISISSIFNDWISTVPLWSIARPRQDRKSASRRGFAFRITSITAVPALTSYAPGLRTDPTTETKHLPRDLRRVALRCSGVGFEKQIIPLLRSARLRAQSGGSPTARFCRKAIRQIVKRTTIEVRRARISEVRSFFPMT